MKKLASVLAFLVLLVLCGAGCGEKKSSGTLTPDEGDAQGAAEAPKPVSVDPATPVIWVDSTAITFGQFLGEVNRLNMRLPDTLPPEQLRQLQNRNVSIAIDTLIRNQLLRGAFERSLMTISQDEVDAVRSRMFRRTEDLAGRLADSNTDIKTLNEAIRLDLFRNRMIQDKLDAETAGITEDTARAYYEENIGMFTKPAGRNISEIFLRVKEDATDEERAAVRAKMEQVVRALDEGQDFVSLVRDVSEAPSRAMGGQLGIVPPGKLKPELDELLFSMEPGTITDIMEMPDGLRIFRVNTIEEEEVFPFEQFKDQILGRLRLEVQTRLGREYVAELASRAAIRFEGPLAGLTATAPQTDGDVAGDVAPDLPEGAGEEPPADAAPAPAAP